MKFFKILRSIITSFLFIFLLLSIVMHISFTLIRGNGMRISDKIDREALYYSLATDCSNIDNQEFKEYAIKYINDYINYLFYKRSYPNFDLSIFSDKTMRVDFENLINKINIDGETIIKIRDMSGIVSNNAIYLLVNISLFIVLLFVWINSGEIIKTIELAGFALILASTLFFIISARIYNILYMSNDKMTFSLILSIIDTDFKHLFYKIIMIYLIIGLIFILCGFVSKRLKSNRV